MNYSFQSIIAEMAEASSYLELYDIASLIVDDNLRLSVVVDINISEELDYSVEKAYAHVVSEILYKYENKDNKVLYEDKELISSEKKLENQEQDVEDSNNYIELIEQSANDKDLLNVINEMIDNKFVDKDTGSSLKTIFKNNRYIALEDKKETILNYLENNTSSLTEALNRENNNEKDNTDFELEDTEISDNVFDLLQDRIGQHISIGEFNTILQSIFGKYNEVFLLASDFYSMDEDIPQSVDIFDDDDLYTITFEIVNMSEEVIEITDVEVS